MGPHSLMPGFGLFLQPPGTSPLRDLGRLAREGGLTDCGGNSRGACERQPLVAPPKQAPSLAGTHLLGA